MAEENWHAARLIPISGIGGAEEQERRATSALLAVMRAVPQFTRALVGRFGAPSGQFETYIEVPFDLVGKQVFPDGLIRCSRGQRSWTALVEVKTGRNTLESTQLETYLDVARAHGFDVLLTISNEISAIPGVHPTTVDKRKLRRVRMHHLSWTEVLTEAVMQKVHRGVSDPEQAWILGELIRYLEHDRSGALEFIDMGPNWVPVREGVVAGTLRATDKGAAEVATSWDQLVRFACLRLGRRLGSEVQPAMSRKEAGDPGARVSRLVADLAANGTLTGGLKVPNLPAPVMLEADLRAGRVACSLDVAAPQQGRPTTRVNWLVRQLENAPTNLRIDAFAAYSRTGTSALLGQVRADPTRLIEDNRREIKTFRLAASATMGAKRGTGRGSFVGSLLNLLDEFYGEVVQTIKPWTAPPPRLRPRPPETEVPRSLRSTDISSQDGSEESQPIDSPDGRLAEGSVDTPLAES